MIAKQYIIATLLALSLAACVPKESLKMADKKFGDQQFKTAISLIELHKLRYGHYPESLNDLTYLGDWDLGMIAAVQYEKLPDGYALDLHGSFTGNTVDIKYPAEFWNGLGLKRSNLKH